MAMEIIVERCRLVTCRGMEFDVAQQAFNVFRMQKYEFFCAGIEGRAHNWQVRPHWVWG
jgi:hypothetical protein